MLTLFRRHIKDCRWKTRAHRNCQCPIAVEGMLHGRKIRKLLDLRSWEAAQKLVRDWEANPSATLTVSEACDKFIKEQEDRELSDSFIRKLKNVTNELKEKFGSVSLRSLTVDEVRGIKQGWKLALITKQKRVQTLRMFFEFCVDSGWMERNPAKAIKISGVNIRPTLPFSETEMEQIFWACEVIRETHPQMKPGIEKKLRALVLLMRHSGLRISDAVILTEDRMAGTDDIDALRTLAGVVEPVKDYSRMDNLKGVWDFRAPLNRLVDDVNPESEKAREFRNLVQRYIESKFQDREAEAAIRESLTIWNENDTKLEPILEKSFLLREVEPLSRELAMVGTTCLAALDYLHKSEVSPKGWRTQQLAQLNAANAPKADLLLMVAEPVMRLVLATAGLLQDQK